MKKIFILSTLILSFGLCGMAQDVYDDIYYNPKKDKPANEVKKSNKKVSKYYVENFADVDVDAYNRRGETYFYSPVDTIGSAAENGEDFTRTANIQRFYNPTIVLDNADLLEDVLANSYGNVEIIYDGYYPTIVPSYGYYSTWPYYAYSWGNPYWGVSWGNPWGWNISFGWYDPWYSWGWNPGWYDPWYGWGWGWNPGWSPAWGGNWNYANYRPNGNHRTGAGRDWATGARPGYGGGGASGAPHRGNSAISGVTTSRPSSTGVASSSGYSSNNHRGYSGIGTNVGTVGNRGTTAHRYDGSFNSNGSNRYGNTSNTTTSRPSGNVTSGGNRYGNSSISTGNHRSNSSSSSSRQNSNYNNSSYRSGSSSAGRSSGGFGGGARSGGSSRGSGGHR